MAKPALVPAQPAAQPVILDAATHAIADEQHALVAADAAVASLARQLNYQGSTDPAVLENSARDAIRRIGAGIFELGGYLLLLKQACEHGQFMLALERLGIGIEASRRYMQIAKRFANSSTSRNLESLGMSKLVELLPLDDDQTMDLAEFGQTGELALDDVARMSVKELRAAVRKERTVRWRQEGVNKELVGEVAALKLVRSAPLDEQIAQELQELTQRGLTAMSYVRGDLRLGFAKLYERERQALAGGEGDAHSYRRIMAGWMAEIEHELACIRQEFFLDGLEPANVRADLDAVLAQSQPAAR